MDFHRAVSLHCAESHVGMYVAGSPVSVDEHALTPSDIQTSLMCKLLDSKVDHDIARPNTGSDSGSSSHKTEFGTHFR